MKTIVYIALAAFLGTTVGFGPPHGPFHGPPHGPFHGPPHGPFDGPHRGPFRGPPHGPPDGFRDKFDPGFGFHGPSHGHFPPPPPWEHEDNGSYGSDSSDYDSDYGPDDDSYEHHGWPHHFPTKPPSTQPTANKPISTNQPTSKQTEKTYPTSRPTSTPTLTTLTTPTTTQKTSSSSSPSGTTTNTEQGPPNISPDILRCLESCISTPEYNPVCGTDGETYDNEGKLFCAQSCGINVTLRRRSVCPPPPFDNGDNRETPKTTLAPPSTNNPNVGRTTSISKVHQCMRMCKITPTFSPVCGTDLVTYMNIDRLKCAQGCGEAVEVLCDKPCAACGANPGTTPMTTIKPTTSGDVGRNTPDPNIQDCIRACPTTPEYNPVCGTNHVTYSNPGHLICAQLCGVDVRVARMSQCGPTTTTTSTTARSTSTISPDAVRLCIRRCPVTSEYNPVCGTDNVTYNNPGRLECAKFCGVDVEIKVRTRCLDGFDPGTESSDGTTPLSSTVDINGNKDTNPTTQSTTTPSTTVATTPVTTSEATTVPQTTLDVSIPQDVLEKIFGSSTTELPRTTSTKKSTSEDDDEDLDIDHRFSEDNKQKV